MTKRSINIEIIFEWHEAKSKVNLKERGFDFEDAAAIWKGDVIEVPSEQDWHGEKRFMAYGLLKNKVICVVFTPRAGKIRIISARSARDYEEEDYYEAIKRSAKRQN